MRLHVHRLLSALRRRLDWQRARDEAGMALILVISISMLITLLPLAAISASLLQLPLARNDQDSQAALSAAESGVQDYINRLNQNSDYWKATCLVVSTTCKIANVAPDKNLAFDTTQWQSVSSSAGVLAGFHYSVNNINFAQYKETTNPYKSFGTVYLTSTGQSRKVKRTIEVGLRQIGYLDSLSLSDINIVDPQMQLLTRPASDSHANDLSYTTDNCAVHAYDKNPYGGIGPGPMCNGLKNYWIGGQILTGPIRSNDEFYMDGKPIFNGPLATADPNIADSPYVIPSGVQPVFNQGIPVNKGTIAFPQNNSALKASANYSDPTSGCMYTGPTVIKLHDNLMDVTSPDTRKTNLACKPGSNLALPADGVIYVQSIPTAASDPNSGTCQVDVSSWASPTRILKPVPPATVSTAPGDDCTVGDVFVQGTLNGQLTIGAENNIFITGNLQYKSFAGADVLGLVANKFVLVNHAVDGVVAGNVHFTPTTGPDIQFPAVIPSIVIDAAILTVTHSLGTSNFAVGGPLGSMVLNGSVAGEYMDTEGTFTGSTLASGYQETYNYDGRLAHLTPPYFLVPAQTTWRRTSFAELPNS